MNTDPGIRGKAAVVTGGGRGIGRSIARRLAAAGANVVVAARTVDELGETQRLIEQSGGRVLAIAGDVSREEDVERLFGEAREVFGPVQLLVNNAGVAPLAEIEEMEPQLFDRIVATNVRAVYLCCRAAWADMTAAGGGAIVNISSVAAFDPFRGFAAYGAAKAFVNAYTRALADEGAPRGIRVHGVAPGAVETNMLRDAFPEFPRNQTLDPDEVAALVETLLSPACRHVSGQTIVIKKP